MQSICGLTFMGFVGALQNIWMKLCAGFVDSKYLWLDVYGIC